MGISEQDFRIMGREVVNNRVPFINIMADSTDPLEETIPQTLTLVWCPAFNLLSFSTFVLLTIWILYIVTLTYGLDNS